MTHPRRAVGSEAVRPKAGGLLPFGGRMRVTVYIDGFNLYYRALKGTTHKWLDLEALSRAVMPASASIQAVKYYTAHISGRVDRDAPKRQHAYLRALSACSLVTIHFGNFLVSQKWAGLVQPPQFRPPFIPPPGITLDVANIWKTEEKGSDVNLGVHLVRDGFLRSFDGAAVLTNDTDLVEPIRIVTQELGLPVTLLTPTARPSISLVAVSTYVRHITPYLGPCQLPNPVILANGKRINKPLTW